VAQHDTEHRLRALKCLVGNTPLLAVDFTFRGRKRVLATSGNTGISVAAIGRAMGHPVTIFMPDWLSSERINLIRSLGAEIQLVSKEEGGFLGSIARSEELVSSPTRTTARRTPRPRDRRSGGSFASAA
jgi:hypothetical protein